jgi:UDP-N-acetylmuramoyl-tripeptide--D-alanyl-D-alanine ligase
MKNVEIQEALTGLDPLAGRGSVRSHGRFTIIDETYNSNPEALKRTLQWVDGEYRQQKTAVLGDMLELGRGEQAYHREAGRFFAGLHFDLLVTVGKRAEAIAGAAVRAGYPSRRVRCFAGAAEAGAFLRRQLAPRKGGAVLFKGSRGMALEKALAEFTHG